MANTCNKTDDVPIHFEVKEGLADCRAIKALRTDATDNVCKEELPIFTDNLPKEVLI